MLHITGNKAGPRLQFKPHRQGRIAVRQPGERKLPGKAYLLDGAHIGQKIGEGIFCGVSLAQDTYNRRRITSARFNGKQAVDWSHGRGRDRCPGWSAPAPGGIIENLPLVERSVASYFDRAGAQTSKTDRK